MRYLVTGATGFVGGHIVDRLLERGDSVRTLVRRPGAAEDLRRRGIGVWLGDLTESKELTSAVAGVDVVIHCAGIVRVAASRGEVWEVNVGGTERLLAASAQVGVARFIYISSTAVYGQALAPITEDTPKRPVGGYGESKWAAEQALWRYHAKHGLPAVALRPCVIYGTRDTHALPALLRLLRLRALPLPVGGRRILDLVYVSDVIDVIMAAVESPIAIGRAYNVTDGETHTWRDILAAYRQVTGRAPTIIPIPGRMLVPVLQTALRLTRVVGIQGDWAGQAGRIRAFDLDLHYEIEAARRDLGYTPQVGLTEGLRKSLAWFNST